MVNIEYLYFNNLVLNYIRLFDRTSGVRDFRLRVFLKNEHMK